LAISRERKEELIAEYIDLLSESTAVFLAEYKGMSVKQMQKLRADVREAEGQFSVTKNTLFRAALEQTEMPVPEELLVGQTATGFAMGEAPTMAKALVDYAKGDDLFTIKGGIFAGRFLSAEEIKELAELPTLDELRGQIIGMIQAPATNIAGVIASGVRQVVNVINAYAESEESAEAAA
jgi:large subunit ribosomal protein L10